MRLCISFVVLSLCGTSAFGFQKQFNSVIGDLRALIREVEREPNPKDNCTPDLRTRKTEKDLKANFIRDYIIDPAKFNAERKKNLENSPTQQSWMDQVADALKGKKIPTIMAKLNNQELYRRYFEGTPIDIASKVARQKMYERIQKNWPFLKDTVFNDLGAEEWCGLPPQTRKSRNEGPMDDPDKPFGYRVTADRIADDLIYSPRWNGPNSYVFTFELGGPNFVEIDKTFKTAAIGMDISSQHDSNKLEDGADKIKSDDSPAARSSSENL